MFTDEAKAVIALTTRLGSSSRPSLSPGKWYRLRSALNDAGISPAEVFARRGELSAVPGVPIDVAEAVQSLVDDAGAALLEADELSRKGIWIITAGDDDYPPAFAQRLGSNSPPVIFGVGDKSLLSRPGVGVVGSRDIDEVSAAVARQVAGKAVELGAPVISGGARGVDQLAMDAAYQAGGSVIGVLADSLLARIRKPDVLAVLDERNTCLVSQQAPTAGFTAAAAMARNKLIYALSHVTVVVASGVESGGTWSGATEAIRSGNGIVAVWRGEGEGAGNRALEAMGAVPLTAIEELAGLLATPTEPATEQLSLSWEPPR